MEPEIKKILNNNLIPDLINIINDYLLTPYQYFKLLDGKKYTYSEYYEFWDQYEKDISRVIYKEYGIEAEVVYQNILKQPDIKMALKNIDMLLDKYIRVLITAFLDANIFETTGFEKIEEDTYCITGKQLYEYLPQKSNLTTIKFTINSPSSILMHFTIDNQIKFLVDNTSSALWYIYSIILSENHHRKIKFTLYNKVL